jgi:hypothetical protein
MAKIDIDVTVKYTVSLSDVEVTGSFAKLLAKFIGSTIEPCTSSGDKAKVADWIADNISERDCCEYEAEIENLSIDGEPY